MVPYAPGTPFILGIPIFLIPFFSQIGPAIPCPERIPGFDNRIWSPFAERAYVRSPDMQMIAVWSGLRRVHRERCQREGDDRRESVVVQ